MTSGLTLPVLDFERIGPGDRHAFSRRATARLQLGLTLEGLDLIRD
jgi:hypothetical protein